MESSEPRDFGLEGFGPAVVVKRFDVGLVQLNPLDRFENGFLGGGIQLLDSVGESLGRIHFAGPGEGLRQERGYAGSFDFHF